MTYYYFVVLLALVSTFSQSANAVSRNGASSQQKPAETRTQLTTTIVEQKPATAQAEPVPEVTETNNTEILVTEITKLADAFAARLKTKTPTAAQITIAQSCPELLKSMVARLPYQDRQSANASESNESKKNSTFRWKKTSVTKSLDKLASATFWPSFGVGILGSILLPESVTLDNQISNVMLNVGVGSFISGFLWPVFFPDFQFSIPVGLNNSEEVATAGEPKKKTDKAAPSVALLSITEIQNVFEKRLHQHAISRPAHIPFETWIQILALGLPSDIFVSPETMQREVQTLINKISNNILPYARSNQLLDDEANRLLAELQSSAEFKKKRLTQTQEAWLMGAVSKLVVIHSRVSAIQTILRSQKINDEYASIVNFPNSSSQEVFQFSAPILYGMTGLENLLKQLKLQPNANFYFNVKSFNLPIAPDKANGLAGMAELEVEVSVLTNGKVITQHQTIQFKTYESSLLDAIHSDIQFPFELVKLVDALVEEVRFSSALPK